VNQPTHPDDKAKAGKGDLPPPSSKPPGGLVPDQGLPDEGGRPEQGLPGEPDAPVDPGRPGKRGVMMWHPEADCHIGLTSGHTMVVPHDKKGTEVIARFRAAAIAAGCLPVGMEPDEETEPTGFDRKRVIKQAIEKMLASDEDGLFTGDGKPNVLKLSARVGFTVDRSEANRVWDEMQKGEDDDKDEVISNEGKGKPKK
jgi:hypothetical protein